MDKETHGRLLRRAMADQGLDREVVADATGVKPRTVTNWRSGATMPSEKEQSALRKLLGAYVDSDSTSEVEAAIRRSPLIKWRQDSVLSFYERNMHEQGAEEVGSG